MARTNELAPAGGSRPRPSTQGGGEPPGCSFDYNATRRPPPPHEPACCYCHGTSEVGLDPYEGGAAERDGLPTSLHAKEMTDMRASRSLPIGTLFMVLVIALASLGVGYGLWSRTLLIRGVVNTGDVSSVFRGAFTDDDGKVDDPALDSGDTGNCPIPAGGGSGCAPAPSGADPK